VGVNPSPRKLLWLGAPIGALLLAALPALTAPPRVQFSREVLPVLNRECLSCHRGSAAPGGYSLESAERLFAGGRHGRAVVPGKPAQSTLLKYLTGELKPQMPPGKPLPLDQVAVVRRWIEEGARIDTMTAPPERMGVLRGAQPLPPGAPGSAPAAVRRAAPVTAVAFSPDGKALAVGGFRAVRLLDPQTGSVTQRLPGPAGQVLALAWGGDGRQLAAGGGTAGVGGEICLWDVPQTGDPWSAPRVIRAHADTIAALAWRPGAAEFATAGPDRVVRVWDGAGNPVREVKDHVDAVLGVAYSPDGKWLATGSLDRTLKLYDAATGRRVNSFANPEGVTAVAFSARSDLVVACADRQARVWPVRAGGVENPLRGHGEGEAITSAAFSAEGTWFAWGAANRRVRLWNGDVSGQRREMTEAADWVYAVALSPDGKVVAAGAADGKVYLWSTHDGKLLRAVSPSDRP
jgi:WD40 repeat protein